MDNQSMERLLTDRAVGQLRDDVAALLTDYLAEHSEWQESANSIEHTVRLAENVFQRTDPLDLPPLDRHRIDEARRASRRSKLFGQAMAVAAAFILGATTILLMPPAEQFVADGSDSGDSGSLHPVTFASAQSARGEDFWSLKRISTFGQVPNVVRYQDRSRAIQQVIKATF